MAFVPTDYTGALHALNEIAAEKEGFRQMYNTGIGRIARANTGFADMATGWAGAITFIDQMVTDNPGNQDWLELQNRATLLVADFFADQTRAAAILTAAVNARDA